MNMRRTIGVSIHELQQLSCRAYTIIVSTMSITRSKKNTNHRQEQDKASASNNKTNISHSHQS